MSKQINQQMKIKLYMLSEQPEMILNKMKSSIQHHQIISIEYLSLKAYTSKLISPSIIDILVFIDIPFLSVGQLELMGLLNNHSRHFKILVIQKTHIKRVRSINNQCYAFLKQHSSLVNILKRFVRNTTKLLETN